MRRGKKQFWRCCEKRSKRNSIVKIDEKLAGGKEALEKIVEARPNLVILDIVMPGLDGLDVLRKIREVDKTLPIVMLTAYGTSERVKEAMELDVAGFIPKGASVKEATSKIKTVLNIALK